VLRKLDSFLVPNFVTLGLFAMQTETGAGSLALEL
jgi:hypothetical protein